MGIEQDKYFYNKFYSKSDVYRMEPEKIIYFPIWRDCADYVCKLNPSIVVDLGCGPAHVAKILSNNMSSGLEKYIGYDFSDVAINMARNNIDNDKFVFEVQDLSDFDFTVGDNTLYIANEFFEHINNDINILERIKKGSGIVFSVPSFNSQGHVRFFKYIEEIKDRYKDVIDITEYNQYVLSLFSFIFLCFGVRK